MNNPGWLAGRRYVRVRLAGGKLWIRCAAHRHRSSHAGTVRDAELGPQLSSDAERINRQRDRRGLPSR